MLIHHLAWLKFRYDLFDVQSFDVLFAPKTNISLGLKDDSFPFEMVPFHVTFVHFRGYVKMVEINIRYLGFIPPTRMPVTTRNGSGYMDPPNFSRKKRRLFFFKEKKWGIFKVIYFEPPSVAVWWLPMVKLLPTWMSRWKLGLMVRNCVITQIYPI